jgi:hypothetical protein
MNSGLESPESLTELSKKYNDLLEKIDEKTILWMELGEIMESSNT